MRPSWLNVSAPLVVLIATLPLLTACPEEMTTAERDSTLSLLFTNDGETRLLNAGSGKETIGGASRMAAAVRAERETIAAAGHPTLMVTSGDNLLSGIITNISDVRGPFYDGIAKGLIGYDAICLGNHDFDEGTGYLEDIIETWRMTQANATGDALYNTSGPTFLSANVDLAVDDDLGPLVQSGAIQGTVTIEKGGETFGIIGLTPPNSNTILDGTDLEIDSRELSVIVQEEVDTLTAAGVNKIIVVAQLQGFENERSLAQDVSGVDIIVAGGGEELLSSGDALHPFDTDIRDAFPVRETGADGDPVYLVTTTGQYEYLGHLQVGFDANGVIVEIDEPQTRPIPISADTFPTPAADVVAAIDDPLNDALEVFQEKRGETSVLLEGNRTNLRTRETNLANLVADSFLWFAERHFADAGTPALPANLIAYTNTGGIRASIAPGDIRLLDVINVLPFSNSITIVEDLPIQNFVNLLENSVSRVLENGEQGPDSGRFPAISGFTFSYSSAATQTTLDYDNLPGEDGDNQADPTVDMGTGYYQIFTQGNRIETVTLGGNLIYDRDATPQIPVTAPATVNIVTNSFAACGGDEYDFGSNDVDCLPQDNDNADRRVGISDTAADQTYAEPMELYLSLPVTEGGFAEGDVAADQRYNEPVETTPGRITRSNA